MILKSVPFEEDQVEELKVIAASDDRTVSYVVRQAIREFIQRWHAQKETEAKDDN